MTWPTTRKRHAGAIVEMAADGPVSGPTIGSPVFMEGVEKLPPAPPRRWASTRARFNRDWLPRQEIDGNAGPVWSGK